MWSAGRGVDRPACRRRASRRRSPRVDRARRGSCARPGRGRCAAAAGAGAKAALSSEHSKRRPLVGANAKVAPVPFAQARRRRRVDRRLRRGRVDRPRALAGVGSVLPARSMARTREAVRAVGQPRVRLRRGARRERGRRARTRTGPASAREREASRRSFVSAAARCDRWSAAARCRSSSVCSPGSGRCCPRVGGADAELVRRRRRGRCTRGEAHGVKRRRRARTRTCAGSSAENSNVALVARRPAAGTAVDARVRRRGVDRPRAAAGVGSVLPAASVARTRKRVLAVRRGRVLRGDVHAAKPPPSSEHSKSTGSSPRTRSTPRAVGRASPAADVIEVSGAVGVDRPAELAGVGVGVAGRIGRPDAEACARRRRGRRTRPASCRARTRAPSSEHSNARPARRRRTSKLADGARWSRASGPRVDRRLRRRACRSSSVERRRRSTLPAASVARTRSCARPRPGRRTRAGERTARTRRRRASTRTSPASSAENANVAAVLVRQGRRARRRSTSPARGCRSSTRSSAGVASVLPAASIARTRKCARPSARSLYVAATRRARTPRRRARTRSSTGLVGARTRSVAAVRRCSGRRDRCRSLVSGGGRVDRPGWTRAWRRRCRPVGGADAERVLAVGEIGVVDRRLAGANAAPSSAHSNVARLVGGEREGRARALVGLRRPGVDRRLGRRRVDRPGVARRRGVGVAGASVARTWNVCSPSARPAYSTGDAQARTPPPSSAHSKPSPARRPRTRSVASCWVGQRRAGRSRSSSPAASRRSTSRSSPASRRRCRPGRSRAPRTRTRPCSGRCSARARARREARRRRGRGGTRTAGPTPRSCRRRRLNANVAELPRVDSGGCS